MVCPRSSPVPSPPLPHSLLTSITYSALVDLLFFLPVSLWLTPQGSSEGRIWEVTAGQRGFHPSSAGSMELPCPLARGSTVPSSHHYVAHTNILINKVGKESPRRTKSELLQTAVLEREEERQRSSGRCGTSHLHCGDGFDGIRKYQRQPSGAS